MSLLATASMIGGALAVAPRAAAALGSALLGQNEARSAVAGSGVDSPSLSLSQRLAEMLRKAGIQHDAPVMVQDDGAGGFQISGPSESLAAIHDLLSRSPDWVESFRQLLQCNPGATVVLPASTTGGALDLVG